MHLDVIFWVIFTVFIVWLFWSWADEQQASKFKQAVVDLFSAKSSYRNRKKINKQQKLNGYQSQSAIESMERQTSFAWAVPGIAALIWAFISHPPIILLALPVIVGVLFYMGATQKAESSAVGMLEVTDMIGLSLVIFMPLMVIEVGLIISNMTYASFWKGIFPLVIVILLWVTFRQDGYSPTAECYLCFQEKSLEGPKQCPSCGYEFKNGGWSGFKAHWNKNHEDELSYRDVWQPMCNRHRKKV